MRINRKRIIAKTLILTMAVTAAGIMAPDAEAAKKTASKPALSQKKLTLKEKAKKKIRIKNVKSKNIKKLTVKTSSKKTATVKKNGKTAFTITAKKSGKATITAKLTLKGTKKAKSLKVIVTVKKADTPSGTTTPASAAPSAPAASSAPSAAAPAASATAPGGNVVVTPTVLPPYEKQTLQKVTPEAITLSKAEDMQESNPLINSDALVYEEDFENIEITSTTEGDATQYFAGDVLSGRGTEVLEISSEGKTGKCLKITERFKNWHGVRLNFENMAGIDIKKGSKYKITASVKCSAGVNISSEEKASENSSESYVTLYPPTGTTDPAPTNWTTYSTEFTVPDSFYHYAVYFQCDSSIDADIYIDDLKIEEVQIVSPVENLPSLYETYKDIFPFVGTSSSYAQFQGENPLNFMKAHYNCITPGNEFKPDAIMAPATDQKLIKVSDIKNDPQTYKDYYIPEGYEADADNKSGEDAVVPALNFTNVDEMLKIAKDNNLKIRFHALVWHEQTPTYFFQKNYRLNKNNKVNNYNVSADTMNTRLEFYVRTVMNHVLTSEYADVVYAVDVVNEYFHSYGGSTRTDPTYYREIYGTYLGENSDTQSDMSTEPTYVKLAFKAAREELKEHNYTDKIKLFYNDFNTYQVEEDICHMVQYINYEEKLCDGVGMQAHLDLDFPTPDQFRHALAMFRVNIPDAEIQITELDATIPTGSSYTEKDQGAYYYDIMQAILKEKQEGANITALIFWSLYDGVSWRANRIPCIFNGLNSPKSAYYAVIDAKKIMNEAK